MKKNIVRKENEYSMLGNVMYVYGQSYEFMKRILYMTIIEIVCATIIPIANIMLPKMAIDLVMLNQGITRAVWIMAIFTVIMVIVYAVRGYVDEGNYMGCNMFRGFIMRKVILKSLNCNYGFAESVKGQTMYEKAVRALARGDMCASSVMLRVSKEFIINVCCFAMYSGVIAILNPIILMLCIGMSMINWFALKYAREYEIKQRDRQAIMSHKISYIQYKVKESAFAKDIRIYSMKDFIMDIEKKIIKKDYEINSDIEAHKFRSQLINAITLILRDGISYVYLIICVSRGNISVGDFVLYFGAITGFSGFVSDMVSNIGELIDASSQISDVRRYIDIEDDMEGKADKYSSKSNCFSSSGVDIEFKNVSFSYDKKYKVLDNFNMKITSGEKVALVGVNGAGKTSIVKLMCGFYRVDEGEILINGVNINTMERNEIMKLYSVVFQDITILPLTIAENISMKTLEDTDVELVEQCLKKAGLYEDIMKHVNGIKTYITNYFSESGINLSGGQLQKLLMARALYKDGHIMVFDEPTAAMDPIAEDEIYRKFKEIIGGKTAVYISHRLSSTRFCDRIIILKSGKVCEEGSHEFLMNLNGEYRKMFELQSHYYKNEVSTKNVGGDLYA